MNKSSNLINKQFLQQMGFLKNKEQIQNFLTAYQSERIPGYFDDSFKITFSNPQYLSVLLETILNFNREYINQHLTYQDTGINRNDITKKGSIGDIIVTIENITILFECNSSYYKSVVNKNLHTFSGVIYRQYKKGEKIESNRKSILISIDNYDILKKGNLIYHGLVKDKNTDEIITNNLEIIHLNLDFVKKIVYTNSIKELKKLDDYLKCLVILVITNKEASRKICEGVDYLMEVDARLNQNSCDYRGINQISQKRLMEGIKREIKEMATIEGREQGIKEGRKEGRKEGKRESLEEIIKNMLKEKFSISQISKVTGLDTESIKRIAMM